MPQIPSLSNLRLGAPTAGKQSKRKAGKEKAKAEAKESSEERLVLLATDDRPLVVRYMKRAQEHFGLEAFDAANTATGKAIVYFLQDIAERFFEQMVLKPEGLLQTFREGMQIYKELERQAPTAVLRMAEYLSDILEKMANWVWQSIVREMDKPGQPWRPISEINRILNEPDVVFLYRYTSGAVVNYFGLTGGIRTPDHVYRLLYAVCDVLQAEVEEAARACAPRPARTAPTPAPAPAPPKSRAEYDRNVQAAKDREAKEAAARLAEKQARDAMLARERDAAAREQTRLEQEREDALVRQLERASLAGSSRDHAQQAPLSPGPEAKRLSDAMKAREAKEEDIAEAKERRKARLAEQAAKDAEEAKEEDRRAEARDTAKRIAHGEGYSKRKGNKE